MPKMQPDLQLVDVVQSIVASCGGSQAEAARRLNVKRLLIHRILKTDGRVTPKTKNAILDGLMTLKEHAGSLENPSSLEQKKKQDLHNLMRTLRYLLEVLEAQEIEPISEEAKI